MSDEDKKNDSPTEKAKKLRFALSLARKAGAAICGTSLTCEAIRAAKVKLVVISKKASENSTKRVYDCAKYYKTKTCEIDFDTVELGSSVGKASLACIGITDENLAILVEKNIY